MTLKEAQNHALAGPVKFTTAGIGLVIAFITLWSTLGVPRPVLSSELDDFTQELREDRAAMLERIQGIEEEVKATKNMVQQARLTDLRHQIADRQLELEKNPDDASLRALIRQLRVEAEQSERELK